MKRSLPSSGLSRLPPTMSRNEEKSQAAKIARQEQELWDEVRKDAVLQRMAKNAMSTTRVVTSMSWDQVRDADKNRTIERAIRRKLNGSHPKVTAVLERIAKLRAEFAARNIRLVIAIAARHTDQGLQFDDLVQEGNEGLIKAVIRFDASYNVRFGTHAGWWVTHYIERAIVNQSKVVRTPQHAIDSLAKARWIEDTHYAQTGEQLPREAVAKLAHTTEETLAIARRNRHATSLDWADDGQEPMISRLQGDSPMPDDEIAQQWRKAKTAQALAELSTRDRAVLELRYGLRDGRDRTLEEVGRIIGVTRERVRQLEQKAMAHVRTTLRRMGLSWKSLDL